MPAVKVVGEKKKTKRRATALHWSPPSQKGNSLLLFILPMRIYEYQLLVNNKVWQKKSRRYTENELIHTLVRYKQGLQSQSWRTNIHLTKPTATVSRIGRLTRSHEKLLPSRGPRTLWTNHYLAHVTYYHMATGHTHTHWYQVLNVPAVFQHTPVRPCMPGLLMSMLLHPKPATRYSACCGHYAYRSRSSMLSARKTERVASSLRF